MNYFNYHHNIFFIMAPLIKYNDSIKLSKKSKINLTKIRPTQWFTPMIGLFHSCESVRATTATDTKGAPIPGPEIKQNINTGTIQFSIITINIM